MREQGSGAPSPEMCTAASGRNMEPDPCAQKPVIAGLQNPVWPSRTPARAEAPPSGTTSGVQRAFRGRGPSPSHLVLQR